ncbi:MAG: DUF3108 domain-containing protein [Bacteroidales bacterium]|nr:DUF3108 domain-containing protein [Bacteroidales bacterium]
MVEMLQGIRFAEAPSGIILWWIILTGVHFDGHAQCRIDDKAFETGEIIRYDAYYNWGMIWLHAGEVEFSVTAKNYGGHSVYHLYAFGTTYKSYDWIFKVREKYQSYVDRETLAPFWYERDVTEGSYTAFEEYTFDYAHSLIHTCVRKRQNPGVTGTLPLTSCLFDVMSAVYYFRSVDVSRCRVGEEIPIRTILDSEVYHLHVRYLGKEEVTTRDRKTYKCIKFAVKLVEGTLFKGNEDAVIWVTDDGNKVPVIVEAQILVGSVKAILTGTQGLKHSE